MLGGKASHQRENRFRLFMLKLYAEQGVSPLYPVCTGMFAQYQLVMPPHVRRVDTLVIARIFQQAIDVDAGFVGEYAFADQTFLPADRVSRSFFHQQRELGEAF